MDCNSSEFPGYDGRPCKIALYALLCTIVLTLCSSISFASEDGFKVESVGTPADQRANPYTLRRVGPKPTPAAVSIDAAPADLKSGQRARAASRAPGVPHQVGVGRPVEPLRTPAQLKGVLRWQLNSEVRYATAITVTAPGAAGLRMAVLVERLPEGAMLRFYNATETGGFQIEGKEVLELLQQNADAGDTSEAAHTYWSPYFDGETITLEIELSEGLDPSSVSVSIPHLSQFFGLSSTKTATPYATSLSCEIDATCNSDWALESLATARIDYTDDLGNSYMCSGTLMNSTASNFVPYFLTANHCISTQTRASTIEAWWFYRAASCGSNTLDPRFTTTYGGATLLYASALTDTAFVRLNQPAPTGTVFAGWSPDPMAAGSTLLGLHHPEGDIQKISTGTLVGFVDCSTFGTWFSCTDATQDAGEFVSVLPTKGTWEGGSSGSGLFASINGSHYLVGQLYGGPEGCSPPPQTFGRFDVAYRNSLSRWLSPAGLNSLKISKAGDGTVVSLPTGIACGSSCLTQFDPGTTIVLAASAKPGAVFSGWSGACSGTAPICNVKLSASLEVSANFAAVPSAGTGLLGTPVNGSTVSGVGVISGYHCSSKDIDVYIDGVWAGKAGAGTRLLGTQGVCGRTDTGYSILYNFNNLSNGLHVVDVAAGGIQLDSHVVTTFQSGGQPWLAGASRSVQLADFPRAGLTATLDWVQSYQNFLITALDDGSGTFPPPYNSTTRTLTVAVSGGKGVITVDTFGTCSTGCAANIPYGGTVALAASAAQGYVFTGWTGNCIGNVPLCSAAMNADAYIVANFAPVESAGTGYLGTPVDFSIVSGVGVISGYHCSSKDIDVYIDGVWAGKAGAGTRLLGTQSVCGRTDTGYSILYNFNNLSNGIHVVTVSAGGIPLDSHTVWTVQSSGQPWLTGMSKTFTVPNFPSPGRTAVLEWVQSYQNFLITNIK